MKRFLLVFLALLPALSGCGIGYTEVLFVTKTNAGLEVSAAPPTIRLDIGRKEGVVAPQFENGKKLPVMASFRFENDGAFAPSVGSAFATGDAAMTMAALYGDDTPVEDWKARARLVRNGLPTDSTLELKEEPAIPKILELAGVSYQKKDVRPVFFGTDTTFGVKLSWTGMTGGLPDTATFGYNRKELALVPVSQDKSKKKMKIASLLATLDSNTKAGSSSPELDAQYIQYFATGEAATLLALQRDVRASMLARLDPNKEKFKNIFGGSAAKGKARVITTSILALVHQGLNELKKQNDKAAISYLADLDSLSKMLPKRRPVPGYRWALAAKTDLLIFSGRERNTLLAKNDFRDFTFYLDELARNRVIMERAINLGVANLKINGTGAVALQIDELKDDLSRTLQERENLIVKMNSRAVVGGAVNYYISQIIK